MRISMQEEVLTIVMRTYVGMLLCKNDGVVLLLREKHSSNDVSDWACACHTHYTLELERCMSKRRRS